MYNFRCDTGFGKKYENSEKIEISIQSNLVKPFFVVAMLHLWFLMEMRICTIM